MGAAREAKAQAAAAVVQTKRAARSRPTDGCLDEPSVLGTLAE